MHQETAENQHTIITASRRLARVLSSGYAKQQLLLDRKAWRSPDIFFLDDWLTSIVTTTAATVPVLLGHHASSVIWERCLQAQAGERLLDISALVRQARQSWQRLHDWRVPLAEVAVAARSQDEHLFAAAARQFQAALTDRGWMDDAALLAVAGQLIANESFVTPAKIVHAGFDRLTPAVKHFFSTLAAAGCEISAARSDDPGTRAGIVPYDNMEAELRAAGAWARECLAKNPAATIGIISSALDKDGSAIERLVREGVVPGWQYGDRTLMTAVNTSYGRRLSDYPAIAIALLLLQWLSRGLTFSEVSTLLRTPFLFSSATPGRCRLELYLRRLPDQAWTPSSMVKLLKNRADDADAARWIEGIERLASFRAHATAKATPATWAERIDQLLNELGWPGSDTLQSDEFQLLNRWRALLNDLARLEVVCPKLSISEACKRLGGLANEAIYQVESRAAAVQLLGPLEAAGMHFDYLWISGLDADQWPPVAHPLTMVSRSLQKRFAMPDSTPDDTLEYSRRVLGRLMGSARRVVLSWARSSEDAENTVSPLIAGYAGAVDEACGDPGWHASTLIGCNPIERPAEDPVPAVRPDEPVAGGAYTVQRQISDPIAAFAYGRLRVSDLEPVAPGLSPSQRGNLIHTALRQLLLDRPSQSDMRQWGESDTRERVAAAVDVSLNEYLWYADPVLRKLLSLERARLQALLEAFIKQELLRRPFDIEHVEVEVGFQQSSVQLHLRIDRIDRQQDGTLLIADYKTGQGKNLLNRKGDPHDYQLVVYAQALEETIGGLLLVNIDTRSIRYSGAAASGEWDPKRAGAWPERLAAWQAVVNTAIEQLAAGDVRMNAHPPRDRSRSLNILSRIQERVRG